MSLPFSEALKKLEAGEGRKIESAGGLVISLMTAGGKQFLVLSHNAFLMEEIQGASWKVVDDA